MINMEKNDFFEFYDFLLSMDNNLKTTIQDFIVVDFNAIK